MNQELLTKSVAPQINITPLIDVLLVLLIIFMVVSPLKPASFTAKVPREPEVNADVNPNINSLIVTIEKDLQLKLNKEGGLGSVDDAEKLAIKLADVFRERKKNGVYRENALADDLSEDERIEKTVFIKAPRSIDYGEVVKVMDAVKGAGASPIGLQIDDLSE